MEVFKDNIAIIERLTRRERLGEMLIRFGIITLPELVKVMDEYNTHTNGALGEFLTRKSVLNTEKLLEILDIQKTQDQTIDHCLEELGFMTNKMKWEKLARHNKLGELLVQKGFLKFGELVEALEKQENTRPEKLLGEILVESGYIDLRTLKEMLFTQQKQLQTIIRTINELMNVSQLPIRVKLLQYNNFMQ